MMFGSQFNRREKKGTKKNLPEEVIFNEKRLAFDGQRHPLPAAYTECGNPFAGIALFHFVDQRNQDPAAGRTDRMAQRDRAAVNVDPQGIPLQHFSDGDRLRGIGFVHFDQIHIRKLPPRALQAAAGRVDRCDPH